MQPDLPWNVAGIPPEAREAARAAARREGLSVGEWLTRRIMRTFAEVADAASMYPAQATAAPSQSARDSAAMLESVSRSESETQTAYKRIEEQLRSVGRRLEASERSQSENHRAMNKAATEINIATREQAQAFDQLGAHVVGLADRITRVEQQTAQDGLKDAVRALHGGLSRVAEQIAQTANQSADQLAALAGNVESVAGKLVDARTEAENTAHTLEQRIAMIDERVRAVERAAHSSADALERTIANIERSQTDRGATAGEMQRQAQTLAQLGDTLDRLNARLSASEAQTSGAMARLEENVARVEAKSHDALSDRRLLGIETALSEIAGRLEHTERTAAGSNGNVEESLRSLANRVDAADKRHREALAELRNAVQDANGSLSNYEPAQAKTAAPVAPPAPSGPQSAGAPIFDLPPFPENAQTFSADTAPFAQGFQPPQNDPFAPPPFADPAPDASQPFSNNFGGDTFASTAQASANESFIQAARRSARAASAVEAPVQSGFPWSARRTAPTAKNPRRQRQRATC